jgi:hypothetical protein
LNRITKRKNGQHLSVIRNPQERVDLTQPCIKTSINPFNCATLIFVVYSHLLLTYSTNFGNVDV